MKIDIEKLKPLMSDRERVDVEFAQSVLAAFESAVKRIKDLEARVTELERR